MTFPSGKYKVILCDPPWRYTNWKGKDNGAAKAHYSCMTCSEIATLPVKELADDNSALLMWITGPKIAEGEHLPIMENWGFRPVSVAFVWNKTNRDGSPYTGLGFYTRSATEFCLLGIRGRSPRRKDATNIKQVITAPRIYRHSEKPHETYERIEQLFPGPYIELFARNKRYGWSSWGDQIKEE